MQKQRQDSLGLHVIALHLFRTHLADHDRVHELQVGRIGGERQMDILPIKIPVRRGPEVVFYIPRPQNIIRR